MRDKVLRIILIVGLILWGIAGEALADGQNACESNCLFQIESACATTCADEICNKDFCDLDNNDYGHEKERECKSDCRIQRNEACIKVGLGMYCSDKEKIGFDIDKCYQSCYEICHPLCGTKRSDGAKNKAIMNQCTDKCYNLRNNKQYQRACQIICSEKNK